MVYGIPKFLVSFVNSLQASQRKIIFFKLCSVSVRAFKIKNKNFSSRVLLILTYIVNAVHLPICLFWIFFLYFYFSLVMYYYVQIILIQNYLFNLVILID